MAFTHLILLQIYFPLLISPPASFSSSPFPPLFSFFLHHCSLYLSSSPGYFPLPCCITFSQPNGITSEHVSLSLLSATPPLIARKLMKQRTRTTPSSFCFLPIVSFIPFALTPFSKYLFPGVPVDFFP